MKYRATSCPAIMKFSGSRASRRSKNAILRDVMAVSLVAVVAALGATTREVASATPSAVAPPIHSQRARVIEREAPRGRGTWPGTTSRSWPRSPTSRGLTFNDARSLAVDRWRDGARSRARDFARRCAKRGDDRHERHGHHVT